VFISVGISSGEDNFQILTQVILIANLMWKVHDSKCCDENCTNRWKYGIWLTIPQKITLLTFLLRKLDQQQELVLLLV